MSERIITIHENETISPEQRDSYLAFEQYCEARVEQHRVEIQPMVLDGGAASA